MSVFITNPSDKTNHSKTEPTVPGKWDRAQV